MAALIQTLGDGTPGLRQQAAQVLSQFGDQGVEALIGAIGIEDREDTQLVAMAALARLGTPAVEPLIRALGDKKPQDYRVPTNAAKLLGKLGDERAIDPLVRAMRFGFNVDEAAAYALAEIGGVDLLAPLLEDMDDEIAEVAIMALRRWGDPRAADFIVNRYQKTNKEGVLLYSGVTLVDFGDARAVEPLMRVYAAEYLYRNTIAEQLARLHVPEVFEPLIHVLKERQRMGDSIRSWYCCMVAAQALGRLNDERAVQPLIEELGWDSRVDVAVIRALGRLRAVSAIEALLKASENQDDEVRAAAGWALAICDDVRGVERLLHDLNDDRYAFHAAVSLAELGDAYGEEVLIRIVEKGGHDQAIISLAKMGNKFGLDELINAFPRIMDEGQEYEWEKLQSVQILGASGDMRAVEPLVAVVRNCSGEVNVKVLHALGNLRDSRGTPAIIDVLGDWDGRFSWEDDRVAATIALGQLGDMQAVDPLIIALDDIDGEVQAHAAMSLAALGDVRALEPLIRLLGEKRKRVRLAAIDALGQLGDPTAIEPLKNMLGDGNPTVSARAAEVLEKWADAKRFETEEARKRAEEALDPPAKIRIPKPTKIWVAGNLFSPTEDQIGLAIRGFFEKHDNLERDLPTDVPIQGVWGAGSDADEFCNFVLGVVFMAKPPGAYYLDVVLLNSSGSAQMMALFVWEGDDAHTAQQVVPGGTVTEDRPPWN